MSRFKYSSSYQISFLLGKQKQHTCLSMFFICEMSNLAIRSRNLLCIAMFNRKAESSEGGRLASSSTVSNLAKSPASVLPGPPDIRGSTPPDMESDPSELTEKKQNNGDTRDNDNDFVNNDNNNKKAIKEWTLPHIPYINNHQLNLFMTFNLSRSSPKLNLFFLSTTQNFSKILYITF